MNTTRCCLASLLLLGLLGGCTGATFHPSDRIDEDGDGFFAVQDPSGELGDREYLVSLQEANPDLDLVDSKLDCDDGNDNTFPEAAEQCDGEDNDCNGLLADFEADQDGDGFSECAWEFDKDPSQRDCNDDPADAAAAFQHPDRPEICGYHPDVAGLELGVQNAARAGRLLDDNCDGELLEGEVDADLDGFTVCELVSDITAEPGDDPLEEDCLDTSASVFPGNPVVTCIDGDGEFNSACGENNQEELATIFYRDIDGDGDGDATDPETNGVSSCLSQAPPGRWVARAPGTPLENVATDCDDFNPNIDGKDRDEDGFASCENIDGDADCDDDNADTHPDAQEACDAEDNDCDGSVDEDYDDDGDGSFAVSDGDELLPSVNCAALGTPAEPYVDDCDDNDPTRESLDLDGDGESTCEGDCNDGNPGQLSEDGDQDGFNTCTFDLALFDCDDTDPAITPEDLDGDGFGGCQNAQGQVDCDDTNPNVFPGNGEVQCDGIDDTDCANGTDPLDADDDNDGASECDGDCNDQDALLNINDGDSDGYSTCGGDCDDAAAAVYPGAPQVCDDSVPDNDCNGAADANEADVDGDGSTLCQGDCNDFNADVEALDADGDGSTTCDGDCDDSDDQVTASTDADGDGWTLCGSFGGSDPIAQTIPPDCNDDDPLLNWSDADGDAVATCTDPSDPVTIADCDDFDPVFHNEDRDGDGISPCGADGDPETSDDDCDDDNAAVSSAEVEIRDGLDNNCSGIADEGLTITDRPDTGDLAITELLIGATAATGDGPAEYFEVLNTSGAALDLRGWVVTVVNTTTGSSVDYTFEPAVGPAAALLVADGDRAVIARSSNDSAYGSDIADFYWSGPALSDAGGSLTLTFEGREIDSITWLQSDCVANCEPGQPGASFGGNSTWRPGHAMGLQTIGVDPHLDNDLQTNLCEELEELVSGLLHGTPGATQTASGACSGL